MTDNTITSLKKWGYAYSAVSVLAFLPFALFMIYGSMFAFDNPRGPELYVAYAIFFGALAAPVVLIVANIYAWKAIFRLDNGTAVRWMLAPVAYGLFGLGFLALTRPLVAAARANSGMTPSMRATEKNELEVVKQLLAGGTPVSPEEAGIILVRAAGKGDMELAEMAVARGANVNKGLASGRTPLLAAVGSGNEALAKFLLEKGAQVDLQLGDGTTPLMLAAETGGVGMMELLLAHNAVINRRDAGGDTALAHIVSITDEDGQEACLKTAAFLLKRKADPNIKDNEGKTALGIAKENGLDKVAALIESHGGK